MAKKIRLNRVNGSDTISSSAETLNQNFELIEDIFETQLGEGISSLDVSDVRWTTSPSVGPSSQISLSTGKIAKINPIPSADRSQSGVVTTTNQEFGGIKSFKDGISTNSITDYSGHRVVTSGGSTVYIGGENGIRLVYNGNELTDVIYPFADGTDLSEVISTITTQGNSISGDIDDLSEEMRRKLEEIRREYDDLFEEQEGRITTVSDALSQINMADLLNQTDGMIENWFGHDYEMEPLMNSWTTDSEKDKHLGDTFTDIDNKICYKFAKNNGIYYWRLIEESEYPAAVAALLNSLDAKSIADKKCTTFYMSDIPAPCYTGDIWIPTISFYMNGDIQTQVGESEDFGEEGPVIYPRHGILFCVRENDSNIGNINDWSKDLTTWSEIQFQKNVEKQFEDTQEAIGKAQHDIDTINDDNTFSVFEKMDFLNNTWYRIAGSYVYNPSNDITYNGNIPTTTPASGFLGTTENGTFWDCVNLCIGDNDDLEVYASTLGELIHTFKELAEFCVNNGLFDTPLESTEFYTSRIHTEENVGHVAKQELADLLYNYYREEEECKKTSYVNAVATTMEELLTQQDHVIQNWFWNGVPTTQEGLPWNVEAEMEEYETNDMNHIGDTLVDLTPNIGQNVYKFTEGTAEEDSPDKQVSDIPYYWKNIKSSDVSAIIAELGIDEALASGDGSIKVFNTMPSDYTYGDLWFFSSEGFTDDEKNYLISHGFDTNQFTPGCIYYCSNTSLTGLDGHKRDVFIPSDWENAYGQGDEFMSMFSAMASDSMLTPLEKNQLYRKWYEISSTDLYGNDNDSLDNIVQDIIEDDESNEGSFRFLLLECYKTVKNETPTNNWSNFYNFIYVDYTNPNTDEYQIVETIKGLIVKLKDMDNGLILCGCDKAHTDLVTDLTEISFTGFASPSNTQYNGNWVQSKHVSMLANLFATYYMEEDNLKTLLQQYRLDRMEASLRSDMDEILTASSAIINIINNDNEFSVSEKRTFLNNVWYRIAGTRTYDPTKDSSYIDTSTGKPEVGFLGTGQYGTFWSYAKDLVLTPEKPLVTKFKTLGNMCKNTFGLFNNPLTASSFEDLGGEGTIDNLYDALYQYLNEEENLRISSYQNMVNSAVSELTQQIDGQITTWYRETDPPTDINQMPWFLQNGDTNHSNHIDDIYKNYDSGVVYLFKSTVDATIGEDDIQVTGQQYYWKVVETGDLAASVSDLFEQLEGYQEDLSRLDGFIQVFGPQQLPVAYSYGDIWFFGGVGVIEDEEIDDSDYTALTNEEKWVPGNIYYCNTDPNAPLNMTFEDNHWVLGSAATMALYNRLNYMTSDEWLSASEKTVLLNEYYKITGRSFVANSSGQDVIQAIESSLSNNGSYYNLYKRYMALEEHPDSGLVNIRKALKDLYLLFDDCECGTNEDTNLTEIDFPNFENNFGTYTHVSDLKTIISDVFNRYYTEEEDLRVDIEEFTLNNLQNNLQGYIDTIRDELSTQLDGIVARWYGDEPPRHQAEFPWRTDDEEGDLTTNDEEHEKDEFHANGTIYVFTKINEDDGIGPNGEGDVETDTDFFWKLVDVGSIESIIESIIGYQQSLADSDGNIQVFGPKKLPVNYNYGDIWFFGGVDEIEDFGGQNESNVRASISGWTAGNIYYCKSYLSGGYVNFDSNHWAVGSNAGELENRFGHITDDGWLSVSEKKSLLDEWFSITGIEMPTEYSEDINNLLNSFEEPGSYKNLITRIPNNPNNEINTAKTSLDESIEDIYKILYLCGCYGEQIDVDTDLTTISPSGNVELNKTYSSYETGTLNEYPMFITEMFSTYYTCENTLDALIVNYNVTTTVNTRVGSLNIPSLESLKNDIQSQGLTITSAIQLMYGENITGGLNGRDRVEIQGRDEEDNVGLWFGGSYVDAWFTINREREAENPLPVVITKNGLNSRIGPLFIKNNNFLYIKDPTIEDPTIEEDPEGELGQQITIIGTNQISFGMVKSRFDSVIEDGDSINEKIKENSTIYLDKNGAGSKIGPLNIESNYIYIGGNNLATDKVTVIGSDYISMGATLTNSDTKQEAKTNAPIYLDRNGDGSRIGPLEIKVNDSSRELCLGDKTENIYSFNNGNADKLDLYTTNGTTIDNHTFTSDELVVNVYPVSAGSGYDYDVVSFDNYDFEYGEYISTGDHGDR